MRSPASHLLAALLLAGCGGGTAEPLAVISADEAMARDLDGNTVHPLRDRPARFVLFLFTRTDCPIANRYAPEVRRLHQRFAPLGVEFLLVYAGREEPVETMRRHRGDFGYAFAAVRDATGALARLTGATVTPEAALVSRGGALLYRGRIDDRVSDLGQARYQGSRHDLEEALAAAVAGRPVLRPRTEAVGCTISISGSGPLPPETAARKR